ncbi:hypothetical protein GCM10010329_62110 [Streptomyces spiroverticillatus]|uniref:Lipoprotein n=1 Tax=Streptomyces finlayi TaxID=67296 RepID=A0A919CE88_9ACTN|nr:hypothetical protein [Streptomyces finlayi]GHA30428.1 hypothetical protein GCM10010329_62110 [Streptomyces spiroverticillatus]GHD14842.1 hypothetical protein GCM10010334_74320 [Streptomyces finlayi]
MQRRDVVTALAAALAVPAALGTSPATAQEHPGHGPAPDELTRRMLAVLTAELDDRAAARSLVPHVHDVGFDWHPETAPLRKLDFLVAYGFGNRPPAGGGDPTKVRPEPGPVNEELADTVARIRRHRTIPVYAQWEIARFLESKYRMRHVISIEPVVAPDGTITYLSTDGVAAQVAKAREHLPGGVGTAGVVGFRDHIKRCVQTTRDRGMKAYAPQGHTMPHTYDPKSGQPWTRRRDLYLVHDMAAQWQVLREKLVTGAFPQG